MEKAHSKIVFKQFNNASLNIKVGEATCDLEQLKNSILQQSTLSYDLNAIDSDDNEAKPSIEELSEDLIQQSNLQLIQQDNTLELPKIDQELIGDILSVVDHCTLILLFKIPYLRHKVPFIDIEIPQGHQAEVTVVVKNGIFDFEESFGVIHPPISLPLGIHFKGLNLNKKGAFILALQNFPDLNLSKLALKGLTIPRELSKISLFYKKDTPKNTEISQKEPETDLSQEQTSFKINEYSFQLKISELKPKPFNFQLSNLANLYLSPESQLALVLNYKYNRKTALGAEGNVLFRDFSIELPFLRIKHFSCDESIFKGNLEGIQFKDKIELSLQSPHAHIESLELDLKSQGQLKLKNVKITNLDTKLFTEPKLKYNLHMQSVSGEIVDSSINILINGVIHQLYIDSLHFEGQIHLSGESYHLNLKIYEIDASIPQLILQYKENTINLGELNCSGFGHLIMGSDYGITFSGKLNAQGKASHGHILVEDYNLKFGKQSSSKFQVRELAFINNRLQILKANGQLTMDLASGKIKIFEDQDISFSNGAHSVLNIEDFDYDSDFDWPQLKGDFILSASADPLQLQNFAQFPAGIAAINIKNIIIESDGKCKFKDIEAHLKQT